VIPLVHVPDDPGPHGALPLEPDADAAGDPANDSWRKLRGLFK